MPHFGLFHKILLVSLSVRFFFSLCMRACVAFYFWWRIFSFSFMLVSIHFELFLLLIILCLTAMPVNLDSFNGVWSSMRRNMLLIEGLVFHVCFFFFSFLPLFSYYQFFSSFNMFFCFELRKLVRKFYKFYTMFMLWNPIKFRFHEGVLVKYNIHFCISPGFSFFSKWIPHNGLKIHFLYGSHKNSNNIIDSVHKIGRTILISSLEMQTQQKSSPFSYF